MWHAHALSVELEDVEGNVVSIDVSTPAGVLQIIGEIERADRVLYVRKTHLGGLSPGVLGLQGLRAVALKIMEEADADEIVIQGNARSTGKRKGRVPRPIRYRRC
jgi:hypothetical protein